MKRGQVSIFIIVFLMIFLIAISSIVYFFFVVVHSNSSIGMKTVEIAEDIEAIRTDLKRILTLIIANASRTYAYSPNEHNLTKFRAWALENLYKWVENIGARYSAIVKLSYPEYSYAGYEIPQNYIFKLYWYRETAISLGYIEANISIPSLGVYNVSAHAFVSLYASILDIGSSSSANETWVLLKVLADNVPVSDILSINVTILYPDFTNYGYWTYATIVSEKYLGYGVWNITFRPYVPTIWGVIPLRIYVTDYRGIVVSLLTYYEIIIKIIKNTPDYVTYYDEDSYEYVSIYRGNTSDEIYTLELDWKFDLHFLLNDIPLSTQLPPPIPPIPVKQLRLYESDDLVTWKLIPFQVELWKPFSWHGRQIQVPVSPADPAYWFNTSCRLVFQVKYPTVDNKVKYIKITWSSDCDTDLIIWNTTLKYIYDPPEYKDIVSDTFRIELIDTEHQVMRDYGFNYYGVAAIGLREPVTDEAYGPVNLHEFGTWSSYLGAWRPYGTWKVFATYAGKYNWVQLPIRVFVILNSTKVGNVYNGATSTAYYDTFAILYVINGTRYIACLEYIYWKTTEGDYGFWMFSCMGGGKPYYYMYLKKRDYIWFQGTVYNESYVSNYYTWLLYQYSHLEYSYPNFFCTHWGSGIGRAVFLSLSAVDALYTIGSDPQFAVTKWAPSQIPQHSLEYEFSSEDQYITVHAGSYYSYWFVIYMYTAADRSDEWKKAYKYSVMFLEPYAPSIAVVEVN